jgi:thioredoxin reductase
MTDETWDCIVVGGGAAGLSAALVLGRARRAALVVDAGAPSNLSAEGVGGLLGHDGRPPAELYEIGRREIAAYPSVVLRPGRVARGAREGDLFALELADGTTERARRVLLATGMDYRPPDLPGLAPLWGRSVFHCPFCHGWEARDQPLAVLGGGPDGPHRALLLRNWTDDLVLLTDGPASLEPAEAARLEAAGVSVDERRVTGVEGVDGGLTAVLFAEGPPLPRTGMMVAAPLHQRSALARELGVAAGPEGPVLVDALQTGPMGQTAVAGVFAAGDLGGTMPSVANAIASGSMAAAGVVGSLVAQEHGMPDPTAPAPATAAA